VKITARLTKAFTLVTDGKAGMRHVVSREHGLTDFFLKITSGRIGLKIYIFLPILEKEIFMNGFLKH
jgi:hypothetical protein